MTDLGPPRPLLIGDGWGAGRPGGLDRYVGDLSAALIGEGLEIGVVAVGPSSPRPPAHVSLVSDRGLPRRLVGIALAARDRAGHADVIDGHFALATAAARASRRTRRLPLVVHFHGPWRRESEAAGSTGRLALWAKGRLERHVYARAREVITLSRAFGRVAIEDYGVSPWRITTLRPAVDLERFTPGHRAESRRRLGLAPDEFVIVTVRRLVPRTGVDVLIDAMAGLNRPSARLVIVGDGPERDRLERQAQRAALDREARFLGPLPDRDVVHAYRAADLSVVPSRSLEGYGLVVLESLACGTPVVVTDAGGLPEAARGFGLPPVAAGDAPALGAAIGAAIDGRVRLPERSECRRRAELNRWADVAAEHDGLYRRVRAPRTSEVRVVYCDHVDEMSGAEQALRREIPALVGIRAHVVLGSDGALRRALERDDVSCEVRPVGGSLRDLRRDDVGPGLGALRQVPGAAAHVVRLALRLRQLRPDLVVTVSLKAAVYGGLAARLAGLPVAWQLHDGIDEDTLTPSAVGLLRRLSAWLPRLVIANSESTAATVRGHSPVVVSYPPVIGPFSAPSPAPPGPLRVGIVGRVCAEKGQDLFLDAFAEAFAGGPERAVVVGGPLFGEQQYDRDLRARAERLGIGSRVAFVGQVDDVGEQLRHLHVLVHASRRPEPFGLSLVEGMAHGLAVIAPDVGGPAEIITDGTDGLLYPPGSTTELSARLRSLAARPDQRARLGVKAAARARHFEPGRAGHRLSSIYEAVAAGVEPAQPSAESSIASR